MDMYVKVKITNPNSPRRWLQGAQFPVTEFCLEKCTLHGDEISHEHSYAGLNGVSST